MAIKEEIAAFLHSDLIEDFAEWSFGKDFKTIDSSEKFMKRWNEKHGHLLILNGCDKYYYTIPKMIDLWMENTWQDQEKQKMN